MRIVDVTQPLDGSTVLWPGMPPPTAEPFETYANDGSFSLVVSRQSGAAPRPRSDGVRRRDPFRGGSGAPARVIALA